MADAMVRREIELTPEAAEKLARLAAERRCREGEIVERALEEIQAAEPDDADRWVVTPGGLPVKMPRGLSPEERKQLEEDERWLASQPYAGLSEAIIEERQSGY